MAKPTQSDPQFKLRLPAELKERIVSASNTSNRSINAEIVSALEAAFPPPNEDVASIFNDLLDLQNELRDNPDHDEVDSLADEITYIMASLIRLEEKLKKSI